MLICDVSSSSCMLLVEYYSLAGLFEADRKHGVGKGALFIFLTTPLHLMCDMVF